MNRRIDPLDGPGAMHVDRICREITAGIPGRPADVRLTAAADLADVLDGGAA